MIEFKTAIKSFSIPQSFHDITVAQWRMIKQGTYSEIEIVMSITGLSEMEVSVIDFTEVIPHLEFMKEDDPYKTIEPVNFICIEGKDYTLPKRISSQSWERKMLAQKALLEDRPLDLLLYYLQPIIDKCQKVNIENFEAILKKIDPLSMDEVFGCINYIKIQLEELIERDSKALSSDPTGEQLQAGIKMFNVLGDFNTIDAVAGGDPTKYDAVEQLSYDVIFLKLYKMNISAKFEKNLAEVYRTQNK